MLSRHTTVTEYLYLSLIRMQNIERIRNTNIDRINGDNTRKTSVLADFGRFVLFVLQREFSSYLCKYNSS
jgi:hypothetical protein